MEPVRPDYDVGVIVARFQTPALTQAHRELLDYVCEHDKVIVVLGTSDIRGSRREPLSFLARKQMIEDEYDVLVIPCGTYVSDAVWSKELDRAISTHVYPGQSVVLYGGRDSFIPYYSGRFDTMEMEQVSDFSATAVRHRAALITPNSEDFRAGVIHGVNNRYPSCYPTVDVAIFRNEGLSDAPVLQLLLARKPGETDMRFPGGFADPRSESYEADARREVMEETGLEVSDPQYVGSTLVDDWRYRNEPDKIKTLLFAAMYRFGHAKPADDIEEVRWIDFDAITPHYLVPEHRPLLAMLQKNMERLFTHA